MQNRTIWPLEHEAQFEIVTEPLQLLPGKDAKIKARFTLGYDAEEDETVPELLQKTTVQFRIDTGENEGAWQNMTNIGLDEDQYYLLLQANFVLPLEDPKLSFRINCDGLREPCEIEYEKL